MPPSDEQVHSQLDQFVKWHANRIARAQKRDDWFEDLYAEGLLAMVKACRAADWTARNPMGYVRSWIKGYQMNWALKQKPGARQAVSAPVVMMSIQEYQRRFENE